MIDNELNTNEILKVFSFVCFVYVWLHIVEMYVLYWVCLMYEWLPIVECFSMCYFDNVCLVYAWLPIVESYVLLFQLKNAAILLFLDESS